MSLDIESIVSGPFPDSSHFAETLKASAKLISSRGCFLTPDSMFAMVP